MKKAIMIFLAVLLPLFTTMAFAQDIDDATETHVQVTSRFVEILREQWGIAAENVSGEIYFLSDFGADNTDVIELVMALEEDFDIEIPDDEWAWVTTVDSAVDLIVNRMEKRYEYLW